jgi:hypothetical protein
MTINQKIKIHIIKNLNITEEEHAKLLSGFSYLDETDTEKREKFFIHKTYYNFILDKSCVCFIEKSYNAIKDQIKNNKKYTFLFNSEDDDLLAIVIIILKSHISRKLLFNTKLFFNSDEYVNYCVENFFKYCLDKDIYMSEKNMRRLFIFFFSILIDSNLIVLKQTKYQSMGLYKTINFYSFFLISYELIDEELLNFSFSEFKLLQYEDKLYIHTFHFSRIFEICKKNFFSNKTFKPKNLNYVIGKINLKIYVDEEVCQEYKTKKSKDQIKKEILIVTEKLLKNYEIENWTTDTREDVANLQRKYSKLVENYSEEIFMNQMFHAHPIYFILYLDFRGRKYYDSLVGPTQSKLLRTAYNYGYYKKSDFLNKKPSSELLNHYNKIQNMCLKNGFEFEEYFYDAHYWCIIGIGKHLINKNKFPIKEFEFINSVDIFFDKYLKNKKLCESEITIKEEDLVEIRHYIKIMRSLTKKNLDSEKIKKFVIIKDATASVNQILMKKLGPRNQESMNYINLGEENEWWDTYLIYKFKFVENNPDVYNIEWLDKVLKRSLIKQIIMIVPYSAGFDLCWENYVSRVKEENLDIEINDELKQLIKVFYKFVKKVMQEKYLYKKSSMVYFNEINKEFEEKRKYIIESETGEADISYFKMKRTSLEQRYNTGTKIKRVTKLMLEVTPSLDLEAFNAAVGPNVAHFHDADELREIELDMGKFFITIHDSYLVDILSCTELIRSKQKHYNKAIPDYKIKNIFILL